jgi:hypothetical protein
MTDDTPIAIPHNELGQPDLQALVHRCGGYDKIDAATWVAWDQANRQWQQRRREEQWSVSCLT